MNGTDTIRLDPNRIPSDAEVELVAFVFDVSESEARSILAARRDQGFKVKGNPGTQASMSPSMLACVTINGQKGNT